MRIMTEARRCSQRSFLQTSRGILQQLELLLITAESRECQKSSFLLGTFLFSFDLKLKRTSKQKGTVLLTGVFILDGHLLR